MNVLFETDKLKIEYEHENAYLINKLTGKKLLFDDFYGDPKCGLISSNNDWAIIAGEHVTIWKASKKNKQRIEDEKLKWIHDIRIKSDSVVEILTDPWNEKSAIWELDINSTEYVKIREFKKYQNSEYTKTIDW